MKMLYLVMGIAVEYAALQAVVVQVVHEHYELDGMTASQSGRCVAELKPPRYLPASNALITASKAGFGRYCRSNSSG